MPTEKPLNRQSNTRLRQQATFRTESTVASISRASTGLSLPLLFPRHASCPNPRNQALCPARYGQIVRAQPLDNLPEHIRPRPLEYALTPKISWITTTPVLVPWDEHHISQANVHPLTSEVICPIPNILLFESCPSSTALGERPSPLHRIVFFGHPSHLDSLTAQVSTNKFARQQVLVLRRRNYSHRRVLMR